MSDNKIVSVEGVDRETWNLIARQFTDHSYEQAYDYVTAAASRIGASSHFFKIQSGDKLLGATSVRVKKIPLLGRGVAYASAGPMIRDGMADDSYEERLKTVIAALKRKLVDREGHIFRIRLPALPPAPPLDFGSMFAELGFRRTDRARSYKTVVIDLNKSVDELRSNLHAKWRNHLNRSNKAALSVEVGATSEIFERFQTLFDGMKTIKGFENVYTPDFFFKLPESGANLDVLIAQKDGNDAGGHVLSLLGNTVIYLFGATNDLGRKSQAGYFLNWSAMLHAKSRGFRWYDLGGIDATQNPTGYEFKTRTGGQELDAVGPYEARPAGLLPAAMDMVEGARRIAKLR